MLNETRQQLRNTGWSEAKIEAAETRQSDRNRNSSMTTHRPATPEVLYGKGAFQFNVAEFAGATPRLAPCWHPALPEVRINHRGPAFCEVYSLRPAEQRREEPNWPWHRVNRLRRTIVAAALLLPLLLPLGALAQEPCKVNVNTASPAQLALLIQTGPALAGKIAAARTAGPLDAAKLDAVSGVGVKWLEYNTPHVAYVGPTTCKDKLRKPAGTGGTGATESDSVRKEGNGGAQ